MAVALPPGCNISQYDAMMGELLDTQFPEDANDDESSAKRRRMLEAMAPVRLAVENGQSTSIADIRAHMMRLVAPSESEGVLAKALAGVKLSNDVMANMKADTKLLEERLQQMITLTDKQEVCGAMVAAFDEGKWPPRASKFVLTPKGLPENLELVPMDLQDTLHFSFSGLTIAEA